jgi:hypothetical protein
MLALLPLVCAACGVSRQVHEAKNLAHCEFRLKAIEDVRLGGVEIQGLRSAKDLSLKKLAQLTRALNGESVALDFAVVVEVLNPNDGKAGVNELEWVLYVDNNELAAGNLSQRIEIDSHQVADVSLQVASDLKKVLKHRAAESLMHLAFNLSHKGSGSSSLLLKIKPKVYVAGTAIPYPGYIEIQREFTSETGRSMTKSIKE